jgi:hypothetical protein
VSLAIDEAIPYYLNDWAPRCACPKGGTTCTRKEDGAGCKSHPPRCGSRTSPPGKGDGLHVYGGELADRDPSTARIWISPGVHCQRKK